MTALAERPEVVVEPTLDELAKTANDEHELVSKTLAAAVDHAFRAGHALIAAKQLVPHGAWHAWLRANFFGVITTAENYVRMATYEAEVRGRLGSSGGTYTEAIKLTRGLPPVSRNSELPAELRKTARKLSREGMNPYQIASAIGVSECTARRWVDPDFERKHRERVARANRRRRELAKIAEQQRLEREHTRLIKEALKRASQPLNEAYRLTSRLDQILGQARSVASSGEQRIAINEAHAHRDKMMDAIVKALGVSS